MTVAKRAGTKKDKWWLAPEQEEGKGAKCTGKGSGKPSQQSWQGKQEEKGKSGNQKGKGKGGAEDDDE